jgi:hypothetical protein
MGKEDEIRMSLRTLAAEVGPQSSILATVQDIDESAFTCTLVADGLQYSEVRLRPVIDGNESLTVFPQVGTWALAARIEDDEEWMIIAVGQAAKYRIVVGALVMEISGGKLSIKSGTDSLFDVLQDIIQAVLQIVVIEGTNPNYQLLNQALQTLENIMQ